MVDVILTTYQGSILGPIARMLGQILEWLYLFMSKLGIENVGICMILFTFIVNLLMFPLVLKQQKFAKMSSIMNPEIMAIQQKYKNKKDQASQQKMFNGDTGCISKIWGKPGKRMLANVDHNAYSFCFVSRYI